MKKALIFLATFAIGLIVYGITEQKPVVILPGYFLMMVMGILSTINPPKKCESQS